MTLDVVALQVAKARALVRSDAELARRAGVSAGYMRLIAGGFVPPPETRQRIAATLGVVERDIWRSIEFVNGEVKMAR